MYIKLFVTLLLVALIFYLLFYSGDEHLTQPVQQKTSGNNMYNDILNREDSQIPPPTNPIQYTAQQGSTSPSYTSSAENSQYMPVGQDSAKYNPLPGMTANLTGMQGNLQNDAKMNSGANIKVLGSDDEFTIIKNKVVSIQKLNLPYGDLSMGRYKSPQQAIDVCRKHQGCDKVVCDKVHCWLKNSNNKYWLIGSTLLPSDIYFSGNYSEYDKNTGINVGPASSLDDCRRLASAKGMELYNYNTAFDSHNRVDNCRAIRLENLNSTDMETHFLVKN